MISKKFDTIIDEFGEYRGFTKEETENFRIYINEVFTDIKNAMKTRKYDFISIVYLGTFFLKVWTVHKKMNTLKNKVMTGLNPNKNDVTYRSMLFNYRELEKVYKRMTDNFLTRRIRIAENREIRAEKKLTKQQMLDMIMDDIQNTTDNETEGDTETSLGE